jgi:hypothetical protein
VVCNQLYGSRASVIGFTHGNECDYEEFWLDDLVCQGDENSISNCDHGPFGESSCDWTNECV